MKFRIMFCVLTLSLMSIVSAQQAHPSSQKAPNSSAPENWQQRQKQLADLKKSDPKKYSEAVRLMTEFAQVALAALGYGTRFTGQTDDRTVEAIKEYQTRWNLKATGSLDYETESKLISDYEEINRRVPSLPFLQVFTDLWDSHGYVSASGTWVLTNSTTGFPVQSTQITCYREIRRCFESTAMLRDFGFGEHLSVEQESFEIERWDQHEIVTAPNQYICARAIRRINRSQKLVTGIRSTISTKDECKSVDPDELHMKLSDGATISLKMEDEIDAKRRDRVLRSSPSR